MPSSPLSTYRSRRDPARTPEPMGAKAKRRPRGKPAFVIQEHHARALHWDFRLEHDDVLVSWALPKGLPDNPKRNHLAVHTEDHPMEYLDFAGAIPKGEYGGGEVSIWDQGSYDVEKWRDDEVIVTLHGTRANGRYALFQTNGKNWMIHRMDPPAAGEEEMPQRIRPMLAVTGALPSDDADWAYEFKWDGVRAIVYVEGGRVRAESRNDLDLAPSFPELRQLGEFLGSRRAVLDGEIVAFDDEGRPNFGRLQQRLHLANANAVARRAREVPVSFLAFDLLYFEGHLLLSLSYEERRGLLEQLQLEGPNFTTPPSVRDAKGDAVLEIARDRGLEGIVAKRRSSRYAPGLRNGEWLKVKNFRTQEVVIGGFTDGKGARAGSFGALLLGLPAGDALRYVGKVGTGFSDAVRAELLRELRPLATSTSPFSGRIAPADAAVAHFVRPELVGEVRYGEWTRDGHLRHSSWRGLRPDKAPSDVIRED